MEQISKDIGKSNWSDIWVSKSDIVEYLRCPFRVFIAYSQGISMEELKRPEMIKALLEKGSKFEESVLAEIPFEEVESIDDVLNEQFILSAPVLFKNNELGIRGIPDLISTEKGKLYPIEIKNHRYLQNTDRLELAFYWSLLSPLRKGKPKPKGFVCLNTGEVVEVKLTEDDFASLMAIIESVREVKENGIEPIFADECKFCKLAKQCEEEIVAIGGLTLILGISHVRHSQLKSIGIHCIKDLAGCNPKTLHRKWYESCTSSPSLNQVRLMQIHAKSWVNRTPIELAKESHPVGKHFAVLDAEYESGQYIFLIGLIVISGKTKEYHQLFLDHPDQEKQLLKQFIQVLGDYPGLSLVTWSGTTADIPQLRSAWLRHGLSLTKFTNIEESHVDLAAYASRNFRFPTKSFRLGDMERYFGFKRKKNDIDGLLAPSLYASFIRSKSPKRKDSLRTKLLRYNKDDIESTLFILKSLKQLRDRS